MEMPNVDNFIIDKKSNIKYNIKAYRKLIPEEINMAIHIYLTQNKKKPKKNSEVTIVSIIGYNE